MYIPWRIILELQISAEQAIEKIASVTRTRKNPILNYLGWTTSIWDDELDRHRFDGVVRKKQKTFHLTTSLSNGLSVVLRGTVSDKFTGSSVSVWVFVPIMLLLILGFLVMAVLYFFHWQQSQKDPLGFAYVTVVFSTAIGIGFWLLRLKAEQFFQTLFADKLPRSLSEQLPWPELPNHFARRLSRPDDELDMLHSPDPTLVDQFETLSREILAHKSTPRHTIQRDTNKEHLSVKFPPRSAEGFEVSIEVDNKGATVFAEGKEVFGYPMGEYGGDTFNIIADAFGALREMLSPAVQIRLFSVNGVAIKSQAEGVDKKGKVIPFLDWKVKGKIPSGVKTERVLINHHMPRRN